MKSFKVFLKLLPVYAVLITIAFLLITRDQQKRTEAKTYADNITKSNQTLKNTISQQDSGKPIHITLPSVGINLPITKGVYDYGQKQWLVSKSSANFADITALPNSVGGNTLVYAHNFPNLFGSTKELKVGDKAFVQTENNLVFEYQFVSDQQVLPTNISIFKDQGEPKLTLLTCAGTWDSQRRLMYFKLVRVR